MFYKNNYAFSTTILNFYMIWGGTNWGGIAHPGVYTSYDYVRSIPRREYELLLIKGDVLGFGHPRRPYPTGEVLRA